MDIEDSGRGTEQDFGSDPLHFMETKFPRKEFRCLNLPHKKYPLA